MVEVFKTDVVQQMDAKFLIDQLHNFFNTYHANFDLEDCDKILRVDSKASPLDSEKIIDLIRVLGYHAEILPDTVPAEE